MPKIKRKVIIKKKSKAPSKGATTPRKRVVKQPSPVVSHAMVEKVCGMNDPFCKAAIGSKLYDTGKIRSLSYSQHYRTAVSTDSNGNGAVMFFPGYCLYPSVGAMVGSSATFLNLYGSPGIAAASVKAYRIVSYGVIVRGTATPMTSSGMVRVRTFNALTGGSFATVSIDSYNCAEYEDVPLSRCNELAVMGKRQDETANLFKEPYATLTGNLVADWKNPGFSTILIGISGGPVSSTPLDLEVFFNYELTFADDDGMSLLATPSPPVQPVIKDASDLVSSETKAIFKSGVKAAAMHTVKFATNALLQAGAAYFFPQARMTTAALKMLQNSPIPEVD